MSQSETASRIRGAIDTVVLSGDTRTVDMGGSATTREFTAALVAALD
jgi:isocitrate dehydrogenase (NAD+)